MKTVSVYKRIFTNIKQVAKENVAQRQSYVTKPDILDISREPRLSKYEKFKNAIKSYLTNLDKQTVKELEQCSQEEFFVKAQKLVIDSYKIPLELAAPMQICPSIDKKAAMMYSFTDNVIFVNTELLKISRSKIFSFIKHEYTHQKQNMQILRTENLGEKALQELAKIKANLVADEFIKQYSGISDRELVAKAPQLGAFYPWVLELRRAVKKGPDAINEFKAKVYQNDYPIYYQQLNEIRQKSIKEYGLIQADSKEAKLSQEYFDGFMNLYKNPLSLKANIKSKNEREAYGAQGAAYWEYMLHKFI